MMRWTFLPLLMGCTAARGTIQMVEAEQDYSLAEAAEAADLAVYAWTMAESYMHKSREEYAHADYEAAAELAAEASEWSVKAKNIAEGNDISPLEGAPNILPETLDRQPDANPGIRNTEDDLMILDEESPAEAGPSEGVEPDDSDSADEDADLDLDDILFDDDEDDEDDEGGW